MTTQLIRYRCELCHEEYEEEADARACEGQGIKSLVPNLEVGCIVECGPHWGWHEAPDTPWVRKVTDLKEVRHNFPGIHEVWFAPLWVITAVALDQQSTFRPLHTARYHLVCPVYTTGKVQMKWVISQDAATPITRVNPPQEALNWVEGPAFDKWRGQLAQQQM